MKMLKINEQTNFRSFMAPPSYASNGEGNYQQILGGFYQSLEAGE
jgi:hypothetical protein